MAHCELTNSMRAVGAVIISKSTGRAMMQLRSPVETHSMCWGLWGGKLEQDEGDLEGLKRELCEELGFPGVPNTIAMSHVYTFVTRDKRFRHVSYLILCEDEFVPTLDEESAGYCWVNIWDWPQPLHRNTAKMFNSKGFRDALEGLLKDVKSN
jgi:ADP-ribose pyrophosphatase YjhB (NUDIX family)